MYSELMLSCTLEKLLANESSRPTPSNSYVECLRQQAAQHTLNMLMAEKDWMHTFQRLMFEDTKPC